RRCEGVAGEFVVLSSAGRGMSKNSGRKPKAQSQKPAGRAVKPALSHVDSAGKVRMVDVGAKPETEREAVARGRIIVSTAALQEIRAGRVKKGDPLQAARLAGILAAKRTSDLIPLCHPLPLTHVQVDFTPEQ